MHRFPYKQYIRRMLSSRSLPTIDSGTYPNWRKLANQSSHKIKKMKGAWDGETVVCMGNGPSINHTEIDLLTGHKVIGVNVAYKLLDKFDPSDFILIVHDSIRLKMLEEDLRTLDVKFFAGNCHFTPEYLPPAWLDPSNPNHYVFLPVMKWSHDHNQFTLESDYSEGFSEDLSIQSYYGYSVIFSAIQLAAYLGSKKIVCIGIDMDYSGPVSFVPGSKHIWPDFSYELHAKQMFICMREYLNLHGIEFINATPGGKVDELPRASLAEILR